MNTTTRARVAALGGLLALCAMGPVAAQTSGWLEEKRVEEELVTPPERFSTERLIGFTVSSGSELRFGVDPDHVSIGKDGVVRYVLVARSTSGLLNVVYEGLRCGTAEFKTYARWSAEEGWRTVAQADWSVWRGVAAGLPAQRLARDAFCQGKYPNAPVSKMLRELRVGRGTDTY